MRQCLELGLHRPKPHGASQAQLEQQRRKLFWSVYIFERKSALVLGRPFAISDKDVDISMPDDDTQQVTYFAVCRHQAWRCRQQVTYFAVCRHLHA